MAESKNLGNILRQARDKLGLGQEDFALALGIKVTRLQKWESGVHQPRFTISEWRRFRSLNPEIYEALMTGTVGSLRLTSLSMRQGVGKSSLRRSDIERPDDPPEEECYLRWVA